MKSLKIKPSDIGKRLDMFVLEQYPEISRSFAQKLIEERKIVVNEDRQKTGYKLKKGDQITVDIDLMALKTVPDIELPVLYEDRDVIVVDKPDGVLTHSKGAYNPEATVASFIRNKIDFPATDDVNDRSGIVHRLDRATSGVIICAKTPAAEKYLQKQFADRKPEKTYLAVIESPLEPIEAIIDMPIARNPKIPKTFYVSNSGKPAVTYYKMTKQLDDSRYLIELKPQTGRTHQLRVHLSHLKQPIVGDILYGGAKNERMLLHAYKLKIRLPNDEIHEFVAKLPPEFNNK